MEPAMLSLSRSRPALRAPALRLFWFHHAGGNGQSYRSWTRLFPRDWDIVFVEYPGRGQHVHLPPARSLAALGELVLPSVVPLLDVPYALFGHSMGSLVAFAVARRAAELRTRPPSWLGVSGHQAPHRAARAVRGVHQLSDEALADVIHGIGGTPLPLLSDPRFRDAFFAVIRADLEVCETYVAAREPRLAIPISAYFGADDPTLSSSEVCAWSELTTGAFRARPFAGGHFFLTAAKAELANDIISDIHHHDRKQLS
jgi:medium-chain acyl-[acyl-carrier-protein] hydrolase